MGKVCARVVGVGLDAADVVGLHAVQRLHELAQLALEAAAHARKLVALPHLALRAFRVQGLGLRVIHELAQLALEAAAHARELVALPHLALRALGFRV